MCVCVCIWERERVCECVGGWMWVGVGVNFDKAFCVCVMIAAFWNGYYYTVSIDDFPGLNERWGTMAALPPWFSNHQPPCYNVRILSVHPFVIVLKHQYWIRSAGTGRASAVDPKQRSCTNSWRQWWAWVCMGRTLTAVSRSAAVTGPQQKQNSRTLVTTLSHSCNGSLLFSKVVEIWQRESCHRLYLDHEPWSDQRCESGSWITRSQTLKPWPSAQPGIFALSALDTFLPSALALCRILLRLTLASFRLILLSVTHHLSQMFGFNDPKRTRD